MREPRLRSRKKMGFRWKLAVLPFRSALLREATLRLCETLQHLGRWLRSGWRAALLLILLAAFAWWARLALLQEPPPIERLLEPTALAQVLVIAALVALLQWVLHTRHRIVIGNFQNSTGDDRNKALVEGLSALLLQQLDELADLYRTIDEGMPVPVRGENVIEATAMVERIDEELRGAISASSEVGLGPLKIPVGALLLPFSRMLRGPRLSGSVHSEQGQLILLARFEGRRCLQWRVTPDDLEEGPEPDSTRLLGRMVEQLAYRILTDLLPIGSNQWKAVRSYTQGLRHWRRTRATRMDRLANLRRAEASFITARGEDNGFARCHYNLGIIYRDLGKHDAAMAAFRRAAEANPEQVDAWYALAAGHHDARHYDDVLRLCERAITVDPDDPRAWNLHSVAEKDRWERAHRQEDDEDSSVPWLPALGKSILRTQTTAVALSWRALARAALRGRREPRARSGAAHCTLGLAIAYSQCSPPSRARAETAFRQALLLEPDSSSTHLALGTVHLDASSWDGAIRAFEEAVRIDNGALAWAWLAVAHLNALQSTRSTEREAHRTAAIDACRHALQVHSSPPRKVFDLVREVYSKLMEPGIADDSSQMRRALQLLKETKASEALETLFSQSRLRPEDARSPTAYRQGLREFVMQFRKLESKWPRAQVRIQLATKLLLEGPAAAERLLHKAIALLELEYPQAIRDRKLYELLAIACLRQKRLQDALQYARHAVSLEPESARGRGILGDVYLRLGDYELAEREWRICLALNPNEQARINLITLAEERGITMHEPMRRRELLEHGISGLRGLLEQEPTEPGRLHYWLGWYHDELLQFDEAIYHIKVAQRLGYNPLKSQAYLAQLYMQVHAWDEAEQAVRDVLAALHRRASTAGTSKRPFKVPDEETPPIEILAVAWLVLAQCWAEREKKLDVAERLTELAARRIPRVEKSRRVFVRAYLAQVRGWIHYKQGALEEATRELERSVALRAEGGAYYQLARVYLARAEVDSANRAHWLVKARRACVHAREGDLSGMYAREIATLEQELDSAGQLSRPHPLEVPAPPLELHHH